MGRLALVAVVGALALGAGRVEAAQCMPVSIDFGDSEWFIASNPRTVTITNPANAPITIIKFDFSGAQASWFALSAIPKLPLQLAANGGMTTVDVVTVPLAVGAGSGRLDVSDANGLSCAVPLMANGLGPKLNVPPPIETDFGSSPVMVDSKPRSITLINTGVAPLHITAFKLGDAMGLDVGAFGSPNPLVPPVVVNAGQSVSFDVVFHPVELRPYSAYVELVTDDPFVKLARLPLAGTGVTQGYSVDPKQLVFSAPPGGVAMKSFRISNEGAGSISVASLTLVGSDPDVFTIDEYGPFMLGASSSRNVNVTFSPATTGQWSAAVEVEVDGSPPATVQLYASNLVVLPELSATPTALDFSVVPKCNLSLPRTVTLRNTGHVIAHIASIRPADPDFRVDLSATKLDLPPGQETTFDAFFAPTDGGTRLSSIAIALAGDMKPIQTIVVRGTGGAKGRCAGDSGCAIGGGPPAAILPMFLLLLAALVTRSRNRIH